MEELQKRARMVGQSWNMSNLPLHILIEIISRLPIKTVMAIRCVCKSLLSVVSDSNFQTLYSTRAPTELFYSATVKSTYSTRAPPEQWCIAEYVFVDDSLTAVDEKKNSVVFELPYFSVTSTNYCNFGATSARVTFVNSCCGLLCYRGPPGNVYAVICNPFTREFITFPCPTRTDKTVKKEGICYGLGFSPKDNNFKFLRLVYRKYVDTDSGKEKSRVVGEIYTFGERGSSWKMVANRPHVCMSEAREAIFHEGALHWYYTCYGADDFIVTFDFDTELFGKLVTPRSPPRFKVISIGVFENCLYCTTGWVGDFVDIWVLKEYGQDSWVKLFSIQKDVNGLCYRYEPFKYLQNGQVLMFKSQSGIVCFNPDTGSIKNVSEICRRHGAVPIRPSLVSLKVLLGDNVKVHSVKPWDRNKVATIPRAWTSSVAVKDVVKADKGSHGRVPGSFAPSSSSEASTSTPHLTTEKVKEDVVPAILESQQGGAEAGKFWTQDPRPPKDRRVGQISSETQKLADEIATLKAEDKRKAKVIGTLNAENERKGKVIGTLNAENGRKGNVIETLNAENKRKDKVIETLNAENDRQGKAMAKLKKRKKKDHAFMRFMYQQILSSSDDSD